MTFLERLAVPKSNPQPLNFTLPITQVDVVRRLHCVRYDRCLSVASDAGWTSFHCEDCAVNEELSSADLREQAESIRASIARQNQVTVQDV